MKVVSTFRPLNASRVQAMKQSIAAGHIATCITERSEVFEKEESMLRLPARRR